MTSRQTVSPLGAASAPARPDRLVSRDEVAAYLGVSVGTMNRWAYTRTGPPYKIVGRHARYRWSDVDAWLDSQQTGGAA